MSVGQWFGLWALAYVAVAGYFIWRYEIRPERIAPGVTFYPWTGQTKITDLGEFLRNNKQAQRVLAAARGGLGGDGEEK